MDDTLGLLEEALQLGREIGYLIREEPRGAGGRLSVARLGQGQSPHGLERKARQSCGSGS